MKHEYKMIDLFAGISGTRLGFEQTDAVKVVFSSEWDKFAQKTYQANFGDMPAGDITKISEKDIPDHDILVGGFPCVAFSQAGKKLGFADTRGTLFFDIARIIREKRPKAFFLENVKNLLTHDKGKTFEVIRKVLEGMDYAVFYQVFAAKDFGVPQKRERIYIVGFDKKQVKNYADFHYPIPPKTKTCVGDILEPDPDPKYTLSDRLWTGHQRREVKNKAKGNGFKYRLYTADDEYTDTRHDTARTEKKFLSHRKINQESSHHVKQQDFRDSPKLLLFLYPICRHTNNSEIRWQCLSFMRLQKRLSGHWKEKKNEKNEMCIVFCRCRRNRFRI